MTRALLGACLLIASVSCTVEVPVPDVTEVPLTFDPVMYVAAKGDVAPGEYPAGLPFGVSAWKYPAGQHWTGEEAVSLLSNERITDHEKIWEPIPPILWPDRKQRCAFLAYAPYGAAAEINRTEGIIFQSVDTATDQTDLLYTILTDGLNEASGNGVVNLAFRHALCRIDFELRCNASEGESATALQLSLDGIGCVGTFHSLPAPTWGLEGDSQELGFFAGEQDLSHTNDPIGDARWVIPQFLRASVVLVLRHHAIMGDDTIETLRSAPLSIPLDPGRHYTFSLSCALDTGTLKVDLLDDLL